MYDFEPNEEVILDDIIPKNIAIQIHFPQCFSKNKWQILLLGNHQRQQITNAPLLAFFQFEFELF